MRTCRFLGNACIEIIGKEDHVIIDPVFLSAPKTGIKHVFFSHHHSDHLDPEKILDIKQNFALLKNDVKLYGPAYLRNEVDLEFTPIKEGSRLNLTNGYVKVFANNCWKAEECVAFLISIDNVKFLHTADSATFSDELRSLKNQVDFCFLACFESNFSDYLKFLEEISPKITIPYHFNPIKKDDPKKLVTFLINHDIQARYMGAGEEFSF